MALKKAKLEKDAFNSKAQLPYDLRVADFEIAMQDVYDFFFDVNKLLLPKGLERLDDMLRPAAMSGMMSDMLTASVARHSRALVENKHFNGHPDLILRGRFPTTQPPPAMKESRLKARERLEEPLTLTERETNGCAFSCIEQTIRQNRQPNATLHFFEVYLAHVVPSDFRRNSRGELGTRTAHSTGTASKNCGLTGYIN